MQKPRARFSISVRSKSSGAFVGSITYRDRAADLRFRSTEIVGITRTGATATITGSGSANGEPVTYVVTVTDARPDRFSIRLSNGYSADSALKTATYESAIGVTTMTTTDADVTPPQRD